VEAVWTLVSLIGIGFGTVALALALIPRSAADDPHPRRN